MYQLIVCAPLGNRTTTECFATVSSFSITVLGGSGSGKSILLKAIAGDVAEVYVTGDVVCKNRVLSGRSEHELLAYSDFRKNILLGELTAREMLQYTAILKISKCKKEIDSLLEMLISNFNLSEVGDKQIQQLLFSGLSDDQKRRVSLCNLLISPPPVLLVDELTSGLDSSMAFDILQCLRELVTSSNGNLSILLTIHQPPMRTLELFDNILLLGGGSMLYFGTLREVTPYLGSLGFTPPAGNAPLDYFLQIYDEKSQKNTFNFITAFESSIYCRKLLFSIDNNSGVMEGSSTNRRDSRDSLSEVISKPNLTKKDVSISMKIDFKFFFIQFLTVLKRNFVISLRDNTLYIFQFFVCLVFGSILGMTFFDMSFEISRQMYYTLSGISFIIDVMTFVTVFKAYHNNKAHLRFKYESSIGSYSTLIFWLSELCTMAPFMINPLFGVSISYFCMHFHISSYLYSMLVCWMVSPRPPFCLICICRITYYYMYSLL